jgi:hypothetical protein
MVLLNIFVKFLKMIKEGSMVLHPKNQFIKHFKSGIRSDKKEASQLRVDSINHLVDKYYNEIKIGDVIIITKSKIDSIIEDIYSLALSFQEKRKLNEPHDIFKIKKSKQQLLVSNDNLDGDNEQEEVLSNNDDGFSGHESEEDDDVPDEQVTLSLIFKQMQKVLQSNKLIKNEVAQLKKNSLIEVDAKFAEMIKKNKKEQEETKKELKEEIKKELELALNKDKKKYRGSK